MSAFQNILNRARNLQHLHLSVPTDASLGLWQTFPNLRWIGTAVWGTGIDEVRHFLRRHQNLAGGPDGRFMPDPDATSSPSHSAAVGPPIYPKLAVARVHQPVELEHHLDEGRPLAHLFFDFNVDQDDTERCLRILSSNPDAARRVTCLQLSGVCNEMPGSFFELLGSRSLPNLAELHLEAHTRLAEDAVAEQEIAQLMAKLTSARTLKVVVLKGNQVLQSKVLCYDREFPQSLEYFCWHREFVPLQRFRFVSSHFERQVIETTTGGKKGFLERVSSVLPSRITKEGVWSGPYFTPCTFSTVLNHVGVPALQIE
ncbi:hypothetical protein OC846_003942 [Tilletia horrida]|uniref:Uncharacterized protein n=1 Tax=Tilletia horrida TaxID=155126 RepID=A0AAN6GN46_9BASI|nr:hypothetical protein OC845_003955 [Tilletia horrida]KAK0549704.1 hypothetical protein OC846_003942 [Tilletia horrida]KAK0569943.1 hypothetical protein OC861_000393 [Tilletia horrida]